MTRHTLRWAGWIGGFSLAVALTLASHAFAQETAASQTGLGLKGIGVRIGMADPEDASSALLLGAHIDAGEFVRNVHVVPSVEYWSVGNDIGTYNVDFSDLALRLGVNFDFPLQGQRLTPYLGGGVGFHFLSFDTDVPGVEGDSDTKFGIDVQGGARNDFTPNLSLFGELGYSFVSDNNILRLLGGLTYRFVY